MNFFQEQRIAIASFPMINAFQQKYPGETAPNASTMTRLVQRLHDIESVADRQEAIGIVEERLSPENNKTRAYTFKNPMGSRTRERQTPNKVIIDDVEIDLKTLNIKNWQRVAAYCWNWRNDCGDSYRREGGHTNFRPLLNMQASKKKQQGVIQFLAVEGVGGRKIDQQINDVYGENSLCR
ncbi:hypothetical protein TNCV_1706221 [Trichonephila clavipes]|nr:hypothetical protein TNCV_1706221 [Trichonephila clavipes]